jgi:hypothetical protein
MAATSLAIKKPIRIGIKYCFIKAGKISYLMLGRIKKRSTAAIVKDQ